MNELEKWVWLCLLPKMESRKITYLMDGLGDIHAIFEADASAYQKIRGLTMDDIHHLLNKDMTHAEEVIAYCGNLNVRILTYDDPNYPDILRKIFDPPYVLYMKGNLLSWDKLLSIGIVGTRNFSEYGKRAAFDISYHLAKCGITIVSGMARGLDSVAHEAAIKAQGTTIAVLGCGIDIVYPPENVALEDAILKCGAVLTEYPPGTKPLGSNFPKRNRIISALSQGVLVVEAKASSGSLITADCALGQDRDVFAVPGSIYSSRSDGTNYLIAQGAKLVTCAEDILIEYSWQLKRLHIETENVEPNKKFSAPKMQEEDRKPQPTVVSEVNINDPKYKDLSEEEKTIISLLLPGSKNCDELLSIVNIPIQKLLAMLTMLEIKGLITSLPGKNYAINDNR